MGYKYVMSNGQSLRTFKAVFQILTKGVGPMVGPMCGPTSFVRAQNTAKKYLSFFGCLTTYGFSVLLLSCNSTYHNSSHEC